MARRHELHRVANVFEEDEYAYALGTHVMTEDGYAGIIYDRQIGPFGSLETYFIELDNNIGGGEYTLDMIVGPYEDGGIKEEDEIDIEAKLARRYSDTPLVCDKCGTAAATSISGGRDGHTNLCPNCKADRDERRKTAGWFLRDPFSGDLVGGPYPTWDEADATKREVYPEEEGEDEVEIVSLPDDSRKTGARQDLPLAERGTVATAEDDYPELNGILWDRPDHVEAKGADVRQVSLGRKMATTIKDLLQDKKTPWLFRHVTGPAADRANDKLPPGFKMDDITQVLGDNNWCRFRRDSNCFFPKELDAQATAVAGYDVWTPELRGHCARHRFDDQKACPISEPGPKSGEPNWKPDATRSWEQGGQRVSVRKRTAALGPGELAPDMKSVLNYLRSADGSRTYAEIEAATGVLAVAATCQALGRRHLLDFVFDDEARVHRWTITQRGMERSGAWTDVRDKGKRIRTDGGVRIIANTGTTVTAEVRGDNGLYISSITRVPGTKQRGMWYCACKWTQYVWARSEPYKRFEGRPCSHSMALWFEMQRHEMFGGTITEDADTPSWRTSEPQTHWSEGLEFESVIDDVNAKLAIDNIHDSLRLAQSAVDGDSRGALSDAISGLDGIRSMASTSKDFKAKVRGRVTDVVVVDGVPEADGQPVSPSDVIYPTYDPYAGLNFTGSLSSMRVQANFIREAEENTGVMVALSPSKEVSDRLSTLAAEHGLDAEHPDQIHLTLAYCGKTSEIDKDKFMSAVRAFAAQHDPMFGKIQGLGTFLNGEESVLWATADVPGLAAARTSLVEALLVAGTPAKMDHDFTPHLTLAYSTGAITDLPDITSLAGTQMTFSTIVAAYGGEWSHFDLVGPSGEIVAVEQLAKVATSKSQFEVWLNEHVGFDGSQHGDDRSRAASTRPYGTYLRNADRESFDVQYEEYLKGERWGHESSKVAAALPTSEFRAPFDVIDRNSQNVKDSHEDQCFFCGRGLTGAALENAWMVHLINGGSSVAAITDPDDEPMSDMGWFPVGSECAKKIPVTHRARQKALWAESVNNVELTSDVAKVASAANGLCSHCLEPLGDSEVAVVHNATRHNPDDVMHTDCAEAYVDSYEVDWPNGTKSMPHTAAVDDDAGMRSVEEECAKGDFQYAGLIIKALDSGRLLMTQRTPYHNDEDGAFGKWEFPGGEIDPEETAMEAALREFHEETGLDLPAGWQVEGCQPAGTYLAVVIVVPNEAWTTDASLLTRETMGIGWFEPDVNNSDEPLMREECEQADWEMIAEAYMRPSVEPVFNISSESLRGIDDSVPYKPVTATTAILEDEPEPALPEAYGSEEDEMPEVPFTPGDPRLSHLMDGVQADEGIADAAAAFLQKAALKDFSSAERQALINEGEDEHLGASNDDRLSLEGTFYETQGDDDLVFW